MNGTRSVLRKAKQGARQTLLLGRRITGKLRLEPDFLIVGVLRGGTTSLYNYIAGHPSVAPAFKKEIHYFDRNFHRGPRWYRGHFPLTAYKKYVGTFYRSELITGEATANYIFHPHAPRRIREARPQVKLIVLLRNPVDRAYSHYCKTVRKGNERLSFEEALRQEDKRLSGERQRIVSDDTYDCRDFFVYSYLTRGIYVDQIKVWSNIFPKDQILIVRSEDLFSNSSTTVHRVYRFLGLENWTAAEFKQFNAATYTGMEGATRKRLVDYFRPHNRLLSDYLDRDFGWDR